MPTTIFYLPTLATETNQWQKYSSDIDEIGYGANNGPKRTYDELEIPTTMF